MKIKTHNQFVQVGVYKYAGNASTLLCSEWKGDSNDIFCKAFLNLEKLVVEWNFGGVAMPFCW